MTEAHGGYYVPHHASPWPIMGSLGLFLFLGGFAWSLNDGTSVFMIIGAVLLVTMLFG